MQVHRLSGLNCEHRASDHSLDGYVEVASTTPPGCGRDASRWQGLQPTHRDAAVAP